MPSLRDRSASPRYGREDRREKDGHRSHRDDRDRDRERSRRERDEDRYQDSKRDKRRHEEDHGDNRSGRRDSKKKRSDSRDRDRRKDKEREREKERVESESEEELLDLKELGVKEIKEDDYFLKSAEFKFWLKEEREKYLDELSSESAHKYFRKFVRRWNDGALKERYYKIPPSTSNPSSSNTAYKWGFATNRSKVDSAQLAAARADVDRLTHASTSNVGPNFHDDDDDEVGPSLAGPSQSKLGPSLPSASDRQLALEDEKESRKAERKHKLKDGYERANDLVPRNTGREGKMEEKRAANQVNKEFREKDTTGGLEVDESVLLGGTDSFAAALKARDAAQHRRAEKRAFEQADRRTAEQERLFERKHKESATMEMFKAMAKERFG